MIKYEPLIKIFRTHQTMCKDSNEKLTITIQNNTGISKSFTMSVGINDEHELYLIERVTKSLLWIVGGTTIIVNGNSTIYEFLKKCFSRQGIRKFDVDFMENAFESTFKVIDSSNFISDTFCTTEMGGFLHGNRIGLDIGGSDIKVTALSNGKCVFEKEQVWFPKLNSNYQYHYNVIENLLKETMTHLNTIDSIGVSTAGVCINGEIRVSSLFRQVPINDFDRYIKTIYFKIAHSIGCNNISVVNDGDVTALTAVINHGIDDALGIAMGTSEAGGYVIDKHLTGFINELAFIPFISDPDLPLDEWSQDLGCGANLLSQEVVWILSNERLRQLRKDRTLLEYLEIVQNEVNNGETDAIAIFKEIGVLLAHAIAYYSLYYILKNVILMGRVVSGQAGNIVYASLKEALQEHYPDLEINIYLPDKKQRRLGQSYTAATLLN